MVNDHETKLLEVTIKCHISEVIFNIISSITNSTLFYDPHEIILHFNTLKSIEWIFSLTPKNICTNLGKAFIQESKVLGGPLPLRSALWQGKDGYLQMFVDYYWKICLAWKVTLMPLLIFGALNQLSCARNWSS
jgi:hypothetical protein